MRKSPGPSPSAQQLQLGSEAGVAHGICARGKWRCETLRAPGGWWVANGLEEG